MNHWIVRLTVDRFSVFDLFALVDIDKSQDYLFCFEGDGDKVKYHTHGHFYTTLPRTTMISRIQKRYGKGNEVFSLKKFKETAGNDYSKYCCKGLNRDTPPDIISTSFSNDYILSLQQDYWDTNNKMKIQGSKTFVSFYNLFETLKPKHPLSDSSYHEVLFKAIEEKYKGVPLPSTNILRSHIRSCKWIDGRLNKKELYHELFSMYEL